MSGKEKKYLLTPFQKGLRSLTVSSVLPNSPSLGMTPQPCLLVYGFLWSTLSWDLFSGCVFYLSLCLQCPILHLHKHLARQQMKESNSLWCRPVICFQIGKDWQSFSVSYTSSCELLEISRCLLLLPCIFVHFHCMVSGKRTFLWETAGY